MSQEKVILNTDQADAAMHRLIEISAEIEREENRVEAEITSLRSDLVQYARPLVEENAELRAALAAFAKTNRAELFPKQKSLELNFGTFGFRWSNWKIRYLVKAGTIVERLKHNGHSKLIRVKETINRERVLALGLDNDKLEPLGLKKTRSERFFVELKREEVKP